MSTGPATRPQVSSIRIDKVIGAADCLELDPAVTTVTATFVWGGSICLDGAIILSLSKTNKCYVSFSTPDDSGIAPGANRPFTIATGKKKIGVSYSCAQNENEDYVYPMRISWK